ncbi:hypothetical protein ACFFMN_16500 [Planobispora siamensis]|uniref:hypothetical protein n=1 Tax=Planobispora siamensis TaxID=936338 RepID=UPI00194EFEC1|nr:hypothetical protein [Planobispora siamensis]
MIAGGRRDFVLNGLGVADLENGMGMAVLETEDGPLDTFQIGSEVYQSLSREEQQETGKKWKLVDSAYPHWRHGLRKAITAVQQVAQVRAFATERLGGENLRRYTLAVRLSGNQKDLTLADFHRYLRYCGIRQVIYDIWLTDDNRIRRIRSHSITYRSWREPGRTVSSTSEYWDFGIPAALTPPSPDDIMTSP